MKKLSLSVTVILLLFINCVGDSSPEEPEFATGIIEAEFIDAESEEPLVNQEFSLLLATEDSEDIPIGMFSSDEDGMVEAEIVGQEEVTVVRAIFEYLDDENEEVQTVEEEISLELRFEEPFDTVNLSFEI